MKLRLLVAVLASAVTAVPRTAPAAAPQDRMNPCTAGPFHRLTVAWDGGETVSCSSAGQPADNCSCALPGASCACPEGHSHPTLDDGGGRCAFDSAAFNVVNPVLIAGFETVRQVYLSDRDANGDGCYDLYPSSSLISVNRSTGEAGNADSEFACISGNGDHVAFTSQASNLLIGPDGNPGADVFVRDLVSGDLVRASIPDVATLGVGLLPAGASQSCWIDRSGRRVVFQSSAQLEVRDGPTPAHEDVYLHDRDADGDDVLDEQLQVSPPGVSTTLISLRHDGLQPGNGPSRLPYITGNSRFVAFESDATDLVDADDDGSPDPDQNGASDVFLFDRVIGSSERVSLQGGSYFEVNGASTETSVSEDGHFVTFRSTAPDLIPGMTLPRGQIYLRDRHTAATLLISIAPDGSPAVGGCRNPRISEDGRFIAFTTAAANLLPGVDTNGRLDLYVYDRDQDRNGIFDDSGIPLLVRLSVGRAGQQGNRLAGGNTDFSRDGGWVPFMSEADNLLPAGQDGNCDRDIFLIRNPLF